MVEHDFQNKQEIFQKMVDGLINKLPEESSTRKQLFNYLELYQDSISYLSDKNHKLAFIGNIGAGKTTAICYMLNLLDEDEPILSTGSGRTTLCEVEIYRGDDFSIGVELCSEQEVISYLEDFAMHLIESVKLSEAKDRSDVFKLSAEVDRALRNMLDLRVTRSKDEGGKLMSKDAAKELAAQFADYKELAFYLLKRINLPERTKTKFRADDNEVKTKWLHRVFKSINNGTNKEVGLAKRIEISVPVLLFDDLDFSLSVLDTKGVDQTVNRQDLDDCITDARVISVICCRFNDAPDKTTVDLLRSAKEAGLSQRINNEIVLLVLDRNEEAEQVIDIDEAIGDKVEGREIRLEHIKNELQHSIHIEDVSICFLDALNDRPELVKELLSSKVKELRFSHVKRIQEIEDDVTTISRQIDSQTIKQAKSQVKNTLEPWLKNAQKCQPELKEFFLSLIRSIESNETYAASVRASINRKGEWTYLSYYQALATGARSQVVDLVDPIRNELIVLIDNMLNQNDLQPAYALLKQLKYITEKRLSEIYQTALSKGRSVYESVLTSDIQLWAKLANEWGLGSGYKLRVGDGSQKWFHSNNYPSYEKQVTQLVVEMWERYIEEVKQLIGSKI